MISPLPPSRRLRPSSMKYWGMSGYLPPASKRYIPEIMWFSLTDFEGLTPSVRDSAMVFLDQFAIRLKLRTLFALLAAQGRGKPYKINRNMIVSRLRVRLYTQKANSANYALKP
jgi:hypothetical protein